MPDKEIGRIKKNDDTDIVLRIDDFGGSMGLTIREHVHSQTYTGFTKAGTRIRGDKFEEFKRMINSINASDFAGATSKPSSGFGKSASPQQSLSSTQRFQPKKPEMDDGADEDTGIDEEGLM